MLLLITIAIIPTQAFADTGEFIEYDIELSKDLQLYTYELCKEYGVPYETALAVMYTESNYDNDVEYKGCIGIMQIMEKYFYIYEKELGVTDIYNIYDNILCGIYELSQYYEIYPEKEHKVLMCYNMGLTGARKYFDKSIYKTRYSKKVLATKEGLINERSLE